MINIANCTQDCLRASDRAARLGGDEFVVVCEQVTDLTEVKVIADKIINSIAQQNWVEVGAQKITASIGIALYPEHGTEVNQLVANADKAMYDVKNSGKNALEVYRA